METSLTVTFFFWAFVALVLIQRLAELVIAKRNRQLALAKGAKEYGAKHYPLIAALHLLWFGFWIWESLARGPELSAGWYWWLLLFVFGQLIRYWAIASLGEAWNTRILIIPGAQRIRRGPYRFLPHPNYIAVAIEILAAPMIFGAWITALLGTIVNAIVLLKIRIPAENKALSELQ